MSNVRNLLSVEPHRRVTSSEVPDTNHDGSPFNFHIAPNIAMGPASTSTILAAFAVPVTGLAIMAAMLGYWPVSLFGGFWFAVLVMAVFRSQQSLKRYEQIFLEDNDIVVEQTAHDGRTRRSCVPLHGLRLESFIDPDYGLLRLTLLHRSSRVDIASDLSPHERSSFRTAFVSALDAAGHSMQFVTLYASPLVAAESSN